MPVILTSSLLLLRPVTVVVGRTAIQLHPVRLYPDASTGGFPGLARMRRTRLCLSRCRVRFTVTVTIVVTFHPFRRRTVGSFRCSQCVRTASHQAYGSFFMFHVGGAIVAFSAITVILTVILPVTVTVLPEVAVSR